MRLLALALLLAGCRDNPAAGLPYIVNAPFRYKAGCLAFHSELELDVAALEHNVEAARWALSSAGVLAERDFCPVFRNVPVRVAGVSYFPLRTAGHYTHGWTDGSTVYLGKTLWALPHELIHVYDERRWRFDTADHDPWPPEYGEAERLYHLVQVNP